MYYITEESYNKNPYKGVFENLQDDSEMAHLVGKRTLMTMVDGATTLLIEDVSLAIVKDFKRDLTSKAGYRLKYLYSTNEGWPVYDLFLEPEFVWFSKKVCFVEEKTMYWMSDYNLLAKPISEEIYQIGVLI